MTFVADLDEVLDRAGIPVTSDDLLSALTQIGAHRLAQSSISGTPLRDDEATILAQHPGVSPDRKAPNRVRARATAETTLLYSGALTTNQVAQATGAVGCASPPGSSPKPASPSRSGRALAALPAGLHPLQVVGFFTTPTIERSTYAGGRVSPSAALLVRMRRVASPGR